MMSRKRFTAVLAVLLSGAFVFLTRLPHRNDRTDRSDQRETAPTLPQLVASPRNVPTPDVVTESEGPFDPKNARQAIARAREILESRGHELGISAALPLGEPLAQGTPYSVQIHFQQMAEGVPLAPLGGVTILFGASGELIRIDSSVLPSLRILNRRALSADEAGDRARLAGGSAVLGSRAVVWVGWPVSETGTPEGRHAYECVVGPEKIVIDAQDGAILYRRSLSAHAK